MSTHTWGGPHPSLRAISFIAITVASLAAAAVARVPEGPTTDPSVIFTEGFEGGGFQAWSGGTGRPEDPVLPPDPALIAPALDMTVAPDPYEANEFLWTAVPPVQRDVGPGAIDPQRIALLRGRVLRRNGGALPGVRVSVLGGADLGWTYSRADGVYDLAVNGGGVVTLRFERQGHLSIQRLVAPAPQDYGDVDDVVMIEPSSIGSPITAGLTEAQVARGAVETDGDGTRQATLLFQPFTWAGVNFPDGTTLELGAMTVRVTEFTVGETGPASMPAQLPEGTGYTYAAEVSVDEAVAAGAERVEFDPPVSYYLENFLGLPVGEPVPAGYYDRSLGQWVPEKDGRIVAILGVEGGMASLDLDGSGQPADETALAAMGVTAAERQRLATLYGPGQSLWRVRLSHFSPWDFNYPMGPPPDAARPPSPETWSAAPVEPPAFGGPFTEDGQPPVRKPICRKGSAIECESQSIGESIEVAGTPYRLHYSSQRVKGWGAPARVVFQVSGPTVPPSLTWINFEISVGGRRLAWGYPAAPNIRQEVSWDRLDRYGRPLFATEVATITTRFIYPYRYYSSRGPWESSFSRFPIEWLEGGVWGRDNMALTQTLRTTAGAIGRAAIGGWDISGEGLGGWSLSPHHRLHPRLGTILLGDGGRVDPKPLGVGAFRYAGTGAIGYSGDGGPAMSATLKGAAALAIGQDGTIYIADPNDYRVRAVRPDGTIVTAAGTGAPCEAPGCNDGAPATECPLLAPAGLAVDPQGRLLVGDADCVRRLEHDGRLVTVAGRCWDFAGPAENEVCDDCPAIEAKLFQLRGLAVRPGGGFFLADSGANQVRMVGNDGRITTVAGTGSFGYGGDGGFARSAQFAGPSGLALGPDGSLFIADTFNHRVRRVGLDGLISTVAGRSGGATYDGDGGLATLRALWSPRQIAVTPDGALWIADSGNRRLRRVTSEGIIQTVAGTGEAGAIFKPGGLALQSPMLSPEGVAVAPSGEVFLADQGRAMVLRLSDRRPRRDTAEYLAPSPDGREIWAFDARGRHLRTIEATTGSVQRSFSYTPEGFLAAITDTDGKVVQVLRGGGGEPLGIRGPYGQVTSFTRDPMGYLATITNPEGETHRFEYSILGLLGTYTNPRGQESRYLYDTFGRLEWTRDGAGAARTLRRSGLSGYSHGAYKVELTTAEGRKEQFSLWSFPGIWWDQSVAGVRRWQVRTASAGDTIVRSQTEYADGTGRMELPDGTSVRARERPDPIWGMLVPSAGRSTVRLPSGKERVVETASDVALADPLDPTSLVSRLETTRVNGRSYEATYDGAARQWTTVTPEGRERRLSLDLHARPAETRLGTLLPTRFGYDPDGRLQSITRGAGVDERQVTFTYDTGGRLETVTDPLGRVVTLGYDLAGRVTSQALPGSRTVGFAWDGQANLTSLTPPGRPAHGFAYTGVDLTSRYTPPEVGQGPMETAYGYDRDRLLTSLLRPDAVSVSVGRDAAGRPTTITSPRGTTTVAWESNTGRLDSMTTPEGNALDYEYDGGLVTRTTWSGEVTGSVERTYDNDFRVSSIAVNGANPVSYVYDDDSLLTQAGDLVLARDPSTGLLSGTTLGVVTTDYAYSPFGELEAMTASVSGTPIWTVGYTRDKLGRITQKVESIQGVTTTYAYRYDPAGRLWQVDEDGLQVAEYAYDPNGNRLSKTTSGGTESGAYDAQDRMTSYGGATYTYTANGEQLTRTDILGTTATTFDAFGNLQQASLPGGTTVDYVVDARNRRIARKVDGVTTRRWLWQGQLSPIAELDATGTVTTRYVYATRVNVPDLVIRGGQTYRILHDHLGSPRLAIDTTTGAVVRRMDFDEWGIVTQDTAPGWAPFGFAGGLYDETTGWVRFGAREYAGESGRWMSKDPILFGGQSPNLVSYSAADPVNSTDPFGLFVCNRSQDWFYAKPEGDEEPPILIPPGHYYPREVDGVKRWGDDKWYKVSTGTNVTIEPDGALSRSGAWTSWIPTALSPVDDRVPGWKQDPEWTQRHPDWTIPDGPLEQPTWPISPENPECPCD